MRVIVSGGTGLIGQALSDSLAAASHKVVILTRDPGRVPSLPAGVRAVRWDARTSEGWGHLVEGADAVVNLAGENIAAGRWSSERKRRIRDSRLDAGGAVVDALRAAALKPRAVIQASGIGFYGDTGDHEVTEESPPGRSFLARFAVEWENSTSCVQDLGIRWAALRTGVVLSAQGGALARMRLPLPLVSAARLGSGRQWFPWIHIADEVAAIRFLIEHEPATGAFNLCAPGIVRNEEFCRHLKEAEHRLLSVPAPAPLLRLVLGEMATELLYGQRAVPHRLLSMGFVFQFPDVDAALEHLLGEGRARALRDGGKTGDRSAP
jgi:uncharacterized protein (TIGR01777 family)